MTLLDGGRLRPRRHEQTSSGTLEYVLRRREGAPNIVLINGAGVGLKGWSALWKRRIRRTGR